ncbi:MAG: helix-turn-helix transcriptional regulator, partial [Saprospiraceae bacterium]
STMNLVKKNELLHQIKADLQQKGEKKADIRGVMRTIDRNTDEAETWNLFREAFENADRDFFKKVRDRHPDLTPNDLKLCAYLRLNLSSKEIAPLLNISVRSVEVKRYRLRKKLDLNRDDGLVEHMLSF